MKLMVALSQVIIVSKLIVTFNLYMNLLRYGRGQGYAQDSEKKRGDEALMLKTARSVDSLVNLNRKVENAVTSTVEKCAVRRSIARV